MFRVDINVAAVASLALAAAVLFSQCWIQSAEAASPEASRAAAVSKSSPSTFAITEETVGKKTFTTGKIIIKAAPARVWDILTDYDGASGTFSSLTKSKVTSSSGSTRVVAFSARALGKLLKFDYTLEVTESYPVFIEWKRASGAFLANEGYWKLEPLESGRATLVTYTKHVDGGFVFPQMLLKKLIRDSIPVIFTELKSAAESSRVAAHEPQVVSEGKREQ